MTKKKKLLWHFSSSNLLIPDLSNLNFHFLQDTTGLIIRQQILGKHSHTDTTVFIYIENNVEQRGWILNAV